MLEKTYMEDRTTTRMKKGWIYRTPYDKKNEEIEPFDWDSRSSDDDDDPVMIQIKLWSRLDDDPVMLQIQWWSRSSDDLDLMKMTWQWIWLEDEDDLMMIEMI